MTKLTALLVALMSAYTAAECPNACSGHGTCALHDQCECCRNFGGADCSERICPFGNAHVDTPKGDIDGSTGTLSGPTKTVIVGSTVYPFGTSEQYPNVDVDEGHAYMECSNKGLCNRDDGTCECFPGYDGTSCQRASCPNDCSGHGTCETIKELAEDKEDGDLATGAYGEQGYASYSAGMGDLSGVGNLKYELWDKALTMGCKCDPGFTGPDCSLKLCRYGVDPLFIPSTHVYSPMGAIEDDNLSPSAPHYEKSFVEIIAKDYMEAGGADAAQMSGNFDLVVYDVYGEKYVLDKLKYAHYDEYAAGLSSSYGHGGAGQGTAANGVSNFNKQVGSGSNHTTCAEIMGYFPNGKLKDTTMGSFQNQMKHRGGLVSSAYVTGTTKPFCSVSSPHGQNYTNLGGTMNSVSWQFSGTVGAATLDASTVISAISNDDMKILTGLDAPVGGSLIHANYLYLRSTPALEAACPGATAGLKLGVVTESGGIFSVVITSADATDCSGVLATADAITAAAKFNYMGKQAPFGQSYDSSGNPSGTFGIRYNFDYNRGNPGYHKDLYVENVIPEVGGPHGTTTSKSDRAYVPVTAFYGTIQQGEVAEYKGDQADDRPATTYDVTLPGYITDIAPSPDCVDTAACTKGDTITFSTDLSSYLYGLNDHGTTEANWFMPDHKTNKIKILNRYYMVSTTKRILVTAKMAARSDYEIGEFDSPTNATLGRFVTQAKLVDDTEPVKAYAQYWKALGVAAGMQQTCECVINIAAKAGALLGESKFSFSADKTFTATYDSGGADTATTIVFTGGQGLSIPAGAAISGTYVPLGTTVVSVSTDTVTLSAPVTGGQAAGDYIITLTTDKAAIRAGMELVGPTDLVAAGTTVVAGPNNAADCVVNFPKTGTVIYLSTTLVANMALTAFTLRDATAETGGGGGCLGCPHNLPLPHEETANAATSGYAYNGRVDFSELNKVYKSVENTQQATGCGSFDITCEGTAAATSYLDCRSIAGLKIGMTVTDQLVGGVLLTLATSPLPRVTAISTVAGTVGSFQQYRVTIDRPSVAPLSTTPEVYTFSSGDGTYASSCNNGFDSMVAGKLIGGSDGFTPDVKLTVKAKLSQPYQYVSECSGRGACDRETGLCQCFVGYTHDNCDTQTPVC